MNMERLIPSDVNRIHYEYNSYIHVMYNTAPEMKVLLVRIGDIYCEDCQSTKMLHQTVCILLTKLTRY